MQTFGALLLSPADTDKPPPACLKAGEQKTGRQKPVGHAGSGRIAVPAKAPRLLIAIVNADDRGSPANS
jgi:propionaldehyde dehydrogenase